MTLPKIEKSSLKNGFIAILIIAFAILVFGYMKSTKPKQPPVEIKQKVWPVKAMTIQLGQVVPTQSLFGTVQSNALVTASSPVVGVVDQVSVKDGDEVKKGEKLVALSDADIELPYQIAKADVEDTKAQLQLQSLAFKSNQAKLNNEKKVLEIREADVKRNQELVKKNLASQSVVDASNEALLKQKLSVVNANLAVEENKLKVDQLKARLQKAKSNLKQAEINRARGVVTVPYNARVAKVSVSAGDRVGPGTALVSYYALNSLELKARIPVSEVKKIYHAMQQGKTFHAVYSAFGVEYQMPLKRLAGEASTSGLDAYFALPDSMVSVRPGDLLQVSLKREAISGVALPYSALYGSNRVYVVKDGMLESRKVEVAGETKVGQRTWVLLQGDIKNGDQVVITHLPNAITGLKVSVAE